MLVLTLIFKHRMITVLLQTQEILAKKIAPEGAIQKLCFLDVVAWDHYSLKHNTFWSELFHISA